MSKVPAVLLVFALIFAAASCGRADKLTDDLTDGARSTSQSESLTEDLTGADDFVTEASATEAVSYTEAVVLADGVTRIPLNPPPNEAFAEKIEKLFQIQGDEYYYPDGFVESLRLSEDRIVRRRDYHDLYLTDSQNGTEKLLLKGNKTDSDSQTSYTVYARVDDSRFVYVLYGWEGTVHCGVFDIDTMQDHVLAPAYQPILFENGVLYALGHGSEFFKIDLNKGYDKQRLFSGEDFSTYDRSVDWAVSPSKNMFAFYNGNLEFSFGVEDAKLRVYSLASEEKLAEYDIPSRAKVRFESDEILYVYDIYNPVGDADYVYEIRL